MESAGASKPGRSTLVRNTYTPGELVKVALVKRCEVVASTSSVYTIKHACTVKLALAPYTARTIFVYVHVILTVYPLTLQMVSAGASEPPQLLLRPPRGPRAAEQHIGTRARTGTIGDALHTFEVAAVSELSDIRAFIQGLMLWKISGTYRLPAFLGLLCSLVLT